MRSKELNEYQKSVIVRIGEFLKDTIKEKKLSNYRISKDTDIDINTLKRVLNGTGGYEIKTLITIMRCLGVHLEFSVLDEINNNSKFVKKDTTSNN